MLRLDKGAAVTVYRTAIIQQANTAGAPRMSSILRAALAQVILGLVPDSERNSRLALWNELAPRRRITEFRRDTVVARTVRLLTRGDGVLPLISSLVQEADRHSLSRSLVVTLVLQESQFYHGARGGAFWTNAFLLARHLPVRRLQNKSLGITSIKPVLLCELSQAGLLGSASTEELAIRVARDEQYAVHVACLQLQVLTNRGATDEVAFLAYAASQATTGALLTAPEQVLANSGTFRARRLDYDRLLPLAQRLLAAREECP